jgi:hemoglobin
LVQRIAKEETVVTSSDHEPADGAKAPSYFDQLGGTPTVKEAVDRFYQLVLADGDLSPYFVDVDMARLKAHQVRLLSHVLGGPNEYQGRDLAEAHAGLSISQAHYTKVGGHLTSVLTTMGAGREIVDAVGATLSDVSVHIVDTTPEGSGGAG